MADAFLVGASLDGTNLADADMSGADVRCSVISGADLKEADFSGADLRFVSFLEVDPKMIDDMVIDPTTKLDGGCTRSVLTFNALKQLAGRYGNPFGSDELPFELNPRCRKALVCGR